jgi:hypothetical protein
MVPGVNLTFEAASSSAASDREIQSEGGFDICQSCSFDGESAAATAAGGFDSLPDDESELPLEPPPEASLDASLPPALEPASLRSARLALPALDFSLRAQPLPL